MRKKLKYLWIISACYLQSCLLFSPSSEKLYEKAVKHSPYDVIIVPGVPYKDENMRQVLNIRVYWAKYLIENKLANNVIFSGSAVYTPYVEGKIMALYGEAIGIPKENIYVEPTAEHSTENLYYSYKLAKKKGFEKVAVATDPYQAQWLRRFARKKDIKVNFIPIVFDVLRKIDKPEPIINEEQAAVKDFVSLKERESFFERLRGTRGKKIKFEK